VVAIVAGRTPIRFVIGFLPEGGFEWNLLFFNFNLIDDIPGLFELALELLSYFCGISIAAVWLVLCLAGRWRAERSWIDRLGRILGMLWSATSVLLLLTD
jgi:hypothetical protein